MKNLKKLGIFTIVVGASAVGYYFLKKNKSIIPTTQLSQIKEDLATIKAKSVEIPKTDEEIALDKIKNLTPEEKQKLLTIDFSNLNIDLNSISSVNSLLGNSYEVQLETIRQKVNKEFPLPTLPQPVSVYSCMNVDVVLRNLISAIALQQAKILKAGKLNTNSSDGKYLVALQERKTNMELIFSGNSCRDKIEQLRLKESALITTKGAIEAETSIISTSNTEQNIYLGVGAVTLLAGLYMIVKK